MFFKSTIGLTDILIFFQIHLLSTYHVQALFEDQVDKKIHLWEIINLKLSHEHVNVPYYTRNFQLQVFDDLSWNSLLKTG